MGQKYRSTSRRSSTTAVPAPDPQYRTSLYSFTTHPQHLHLHLLAVNLRPILSTKILDRRCWKEAPSRPKDRRLCFVHPSTLAGWPLVWRWFSTGQRRPDLHDAHPSSAPPAARLGLTSLKCPNSSTDVSSQIAIGCRYTRTCIRGALLHFPLHYQYYFFFVLVQSTCMLITWAGCSFSI